MVETEHPDVFPDVGLCCGQMLNTNFIYFNLQSVDGRAIRVDEAGKGGSGRSGGGGYRGGSGGGRGGGYFRGGRGRGGSRGDHVIGILSCFDLSLVLECIYPQSNLI